ncbi:PA2779 family protein [Syntrophus aciditrophicus]|nr:PA2779 family protein [Syntrophus aciditrophicus]
MINRFRHPVLATLTALLLSWLVAFPATAAMMPSQASSQETAAIVFQQAEIDKIQRCLENRIVQEKLQAYGLSSEEVRAKLQQMTDRQVHMLAQASDQVLKGGDGIGVVIGVLVIILLVIVILKLLNKEIIIR